MRKTSLYGLVDAGAAMAAPGAGPYNPVSEKNLGSKYYNAVQKDLTKRYGKNGMKKNPAENRGNKKNRVAT